jgi:hypothetical protein
MLDDEQCPIALAPGSRFASSRSIACRTMPDNPQRGVASLGHNQIQYVRQGAAKTLSAALPQSQKDFEPQRRRGAEKRKREATNGTNDHEWEGSIPIPIPILSYSWPFVPFVAVVSAAFLLCGFSSLRLRVSAVKNL